MKAVTLFDGCRLGMAGSVLLFLPRIIDVKIKEGGEQNEKIVNGRTCRDLHLSDAKKVSKGRHDNEEDVSDSESTVSSSRRYVDTDDQLTDNYHMKNKLIAPH